MQGMGTLGLSVFGSRDLPQGVGQPINGLLTQEKQQ